VEANVRKRGIAYIDGRSERRLALEMREHYRIRVVATPSVVIASAQGAQLGADPCAVQQVALLVVVTSAPAVWIALTGSIDPAAPGAPRCQARGLNVCKIGVLDPLRRCDA
jgi:methylthioribose-1-phosphate isomerase